MSKVIHLPSGEQLRTCAMCGAAVLDMAAHDVWHARIETLDDRVTDIENDTEPIASADYPNPAPEE